MRLFDELIKIELLVVNNPIVTNELHQVAIRWNQHLAPSRASILPRGKPDMPYLLPELYNSASSKILFNEASTCRSF